MKDKVMFRCELAEVFERHGWDFADNLPTLEQLMATPECLLSESDKEEIRRDVQLGEQLASGRLH